MEKRIESSELEEIRSAHIKYNEIQSAISDSAIRIHRFQTQQSVLINKIHDAMNELSSIESKLKEKYGAKRIDLTSGIYE